MADVSRHDRWLRASRGSPAVAWFIGIVGLIATACSSPGPGAAAPPPASTAAVAPTLVATLAPQANQTSTQNTAIDQLFIDMMVPHHEGALADDMLRTQDAEISRMRAWRQEWFGSSSTPPMVRMPMLGGPAGMNASGTTMDMAADVERLRNAPEPFDLAFIDAMIPHHQSAIEAARVAVKESTRPEIQDLSIAILEAQQREIGHMQTWRLAWSQGTTIVPTSGGQSPDMDTPMHMVPGEDMNH